MIAELKKPKELQLQSAHPAPAWCRNVLRLVTSIRSVDGAVVGLKRDDRWITFTLGADTCSTDELVEMCDRALAGELGMPDSKKDGSIAAQPRHTAGGLGGFAVRFSQIFPQLEALGRVTPYCTKIRENRMDIDLNLHIVAHAANWLRAGNGII